MTLKSIRIYTYNSNHLYTIGEDYGDLGRVERIIADPMYTERGVTIVFSHSTLEFSGNVQFQLISTAESYKPSVSMSAGGGRA